MQLILDRAGFPNPDSTDAEGLAGVSPYLDATMMVDGYKKGFFPWFEIENFFYWYSPPLRMFFDLNHDYHFSKSLRKAVKSGRFEVRMNSHFAGVLDGCASVQRKGQESTWLSKRFRQVFLNLHYKGIAHSIETYSDGKLVGGLFGLSVSGFFSGESMFHTETDASKVALVHLLYYLRENQYDYIDCQLPNNHLKSLGGQFIERKDYLILLEKALNKQINPDIWVKRELNAPAFT